MSPCSLLLTLKDINKLEIIIIFICYGGRVGSCALLLRVIIEGLAVIRAQVQNFNILLQGKTCTYF